MGENKFLPLWDVPVSRNTNYHGSIFCLSLWDRICRSIQGLPCLTPGMTQAQILVLKLHVTSKQLLEVWATLTSNPHHLYDLKKFLSPFAITPFSHSRSLRTSHLIFVYVLFCLFKKVVERNCSM